MFINNPFVGRNFIILSLVAALTGCGGGSSGSDIISSLSSSISAAFSGPIAGIGSIVVNGVRFETVGVTVEDADDIYGTQVSNNSLALGMTVALAGSVDDNSKTGTPSKIRVIGGVRGKVSGTTLTSITTLNGQTVTVDANTVFVGLRTSIATIAVNDYVEIYGIAQANGDFLATRVVSSATLTSSNKLAIRGTIDSIPSTNNYVIRTSSIATVNVVCDPTATPACLVKPTGAALVVGTSVRVLAADTTSLVSGVLTATKIQMLNQDVLTTFTGINPSYVRIKGFTKLVGADWFVGNTKTSGYTFTPGQYVEVKGNFVNGVLQVISVDTESNRNVNNVPYKNEFYGSVSSISGATFVVQGVTVDATSAVMTGGTLLGLANGNYVEVKGTMNNGVLIAITVDIKNSSSTYSSTTFTNGQFEIYGTATGLTSLANSFTITTANPTVAYTALANNAIVMGNNIVNGSIVEAKGYMDSNQKFIVTKMEVKNPSFVP